MNDYIFEKPLFDQPCFYTIEQRIQIIKTAITGEALDIAINIL